MANPANSAVQNLLPVQALFNLDNTFNTFIGQGQPFFASINPSQSGLNITSSTINSTTIGATTPSTGVFTNILTTTGQVTTSPTSNSDIANKYYVDSIAQGLSPKGAVKCATTANITLSGLQTIDTYTTLAGDRVLVKNQTNSAENGIYIASSSAWTRSTDMDVWSEVPGAYTVVINGSTNANTSWVTTAADTGTIGVTAMPWVQFSGSGTYFAGTGLSLSSNTFSITNTGVTAASVGSASKTLTATVNAQGQLTALADTNIAIGATQITSGTIDTARISGSYTGITGVGTLTAGTWNASTIGVAYGGTGATTLTGYVKGSGTSAFTASATVPTTDLSGTISNAQLANSTISGVSLGSNLFSLTIGSNLSGTSYNGSAAVTITNTAPMVYPGSGIPNSTGSAWGTSYSTTGSGTVLALATGATLNSPTVSDYETFTAASAPTYTSGRLWYDSTLKALSYNNDVTNNTIHLGQETQLKVYNNTGSTIAKGAPVYITSTTSGFTYPLIALAKADNQTTGACIGLTNEAIATGSEGYVVINGILNGVNTGSFTVGDTLYVSPYSAGQLMNTYPPTSYAVKIGVVAYANSPNGSIYVNQSNAYVLSNGIVGQVAIANGGTNGTATPTAGAIAYGSGTAYAFTAAGTTGQVLTSNGSSTPTWTSPASSITLSDDTTTNATRYPLYAAATSGTISTEYVSSTKLQFNPSTGVFTSTSFSGAGTGLTGTASSLSIGGNAATATSATTATNLAGGANGSVPYQTGSGATTFLAAGTNGYVMTLASGVPTWAASSSSGITISDDTTTNATRYLTFTSATSGSVTSENVASTKLQFNPSTGALSATSFSGAGTGLTGTAASLSIGGNSANVTGIVAEANGGTGSIYGWNDFKNRIINGAMMFSQRNGTSATSVSGNDVYTIDRYKGWANGGGVFSVTQSTTAPSGFSNSALITVTTADSSIAAGDNYRFAQVIEGYNVADFGFGASGASTVTLSFWVRSSVTGTFGGSFYSSPATRSYVFNYTISSANTWTYITTTATGDTTGSWNNTNGQGMTIYFDMGSGSNYENATGSWVAGEKFRTSGNATLISTNGATWYVTGIQVEKGSTATSFDYRPYGTELLLCQRYFNKITSDGTGDAGIAIGGQSSVTNSFFGICFTQMRAEPTATASNINVTDYASYDTAGTLNAITAGYSTAWLSIGHAVSGANFRLAGLKTLTTGYITLSAEL